MSLKSFLFALVVFLFFSVSASAQNVSAINSRLDSLLTVLETNNKVMVSVTITQSGKIVYSRATGFIDNTGASPVASSPETRYRIGSISKLFTSVL